MNSKSHWESVYGTRGTTSLSWYQPHPRRSLDLIDRTAVAKTARILDVGGGDSLLVDELVSSGYTDITVVDLSIAALDRARARLGRTASARVTWLEGDILDVHMPGEPFDVWHDRAVFHFLTSAKERGSYIERVERSVRPGGHVIVATFAEDGPTRCSGLPVVRYSATELHGTFGSDFQLLASEREVHRTPTGAEQSFTYCWCQYEPVAVGTR
jgi:2-polyprenyl-3-methyl-5-hydroxy-6-metoxy-1,4-benzoquinol methylase